MATILLGYNNYIDGAVLSGGSWSVPLPLANLQNRVLSKKARSNDAAANSTIINMDLGSAKPVRAFGAIAGNLSASGASFRLRGGNDVSFSTHLYDSGTLSANPHTPHLIMGLDSIVTARYWRLELIDTGNASGHVQLGRLFIGPALAPVDNYNKGAEIGYQTRSRVVESVGGAEYFDKKPLRRSFRFGLDWLSDAEAFHQALELQRLSDITEEVLLITNRADIPYGQKRHFLGRLSQLNPLTNPYLTIYQTAFEVLEIV